MPHLYSTPHLHCDWLYVTNRDEFEKLRREIAMRSKTRLLWIIDLLPIIQINVFYCLVKHARTHSLGEIYFSTADVKQDSALQRAVRHTWIFESHFTLIAHPVRSVIEGFLSCLCLDRPTNSVFMKIHGNDEMNVPFYSPGDLSEWKLL